MPGLPTAASMVLASIRISPASGMMANDAGAGYGTSVVTGEPSATQASNPPCSTLILG